MVFLGVMMRKVRTDLGLKAYELAKEAGVCPVYITQIERHGKLPSLEVMKKISIILNSKELFKIYLEAKYPMASAEFNKDGINTGFKNINEALLFELREMRAALERIEKRVN